MVSIGSNLRRLREQKNVSQEFMAQKLELSTKSYGNIENNVTKITLDRLTQICNILEIDPIAMLSFDSEKIIQNITNSHIVSGTYNDSAISEKERQQYECRIGDMQKK